MQLHTVTERTLQAGISGKSGSAEIYMREVRDTSQMKVTWNLLPWSVLMAIHLNGFFFLQDGTNAWRIRLPMAIIAANHERGR